MSDIVGYNEPVVKIACNTCKHFIRDADADYFSCAAFKRIPDIILIGQNMHHKPLEGQGNKIVYEKEQ